MQSIAQTALAAAVAATVAAAAAAVVAVTAVVCKEQRRRLLETQSALSTPPEFGTKRACEDRRQRNCETPLGTDSSRDTASSLHPQSSRSARSLPLDQRKASTIQQLIIREKRERAASMLKLHEQVMRDCDRLKGKV